MNRVERRRKAGFTLVELLTVIAIVAVLATLLASTLASAQRKGRRTACISNLRQVGLAVHMYWDDHEKRPAQFASLLERSYLSTTNVLKCPDDRVGDWGGKVERSATGGESFLTTGIAMANPAAMPIPYSYLHPLPWPDPAWEVLPKAQDKLGVAACQLHGIGNQQYPSYQSYEGLVFRAQLDGVVVRRQVYWNNNTRSMDMVAAPGVAGPATVLNASYPYELFMDVE